MNILLQFLLLLQNVWNCNWLMMCSYCRWFMRAQMLCFSLLPLMRKILAPSPAAQPTLPARWRHLPNLSSKVRINESFVNLTLLLKVFVVVFVQFHSVASCLSILLMCTWNYICHERTQKVICNFYHLLTLSLYNLKTVHWFCTAIIEIFFNLGENVFLKICIWYITML